MERALRGGEQAGRVVPVALGEFSAEARQFLRVDGRVVQGAQ
jgi:hypothetical protein